MDLYEKIDLELAHQGKSRRKLAIEANIPPSTFQSMMERKRGMSIETLQKIADALGCTAADLDENLWTKDAIVITSPLAEQTRDLFNELPNDAAKTQAINYIINLLWSRWNCHPIPVLEDLLYILEKDETLAKMVVDKLETLTVEKNHSAPNTDSTQK